MELEELIEDLRKTFTIHQAGGMYLKFDECIALLTELYNKYEFADEAVKGYNYYESIIIDFLDDRNEMNKLLEQQATTLEIFAAYIEGIASKIKDDYGQELGRGFWLEGLPLEIEHHDFNGIYKRFKEQHDYHEKISFEEHLDKNGFTLEDANSYAAHVYVNKYNNWTNLLNTFYEDIKIGNFAGLCKLYKDMYTYGDLIKLLSMHCAVIRSHIHTKSREPSTENFSNISK